MPIETLLQTKLNYPRLPDDLISRPRLLEWLNRGLDRKLTLICAPAGYGKSTLVATYAETCPDPVAWLSLDKTDDDLYRFLAYVVAAIQTVFPDGCSQTQNLLQATTPPSLEYLSVTFINEIAALSEPFILILDDYQRLKQEDIHQFMIMLIDHMPAPLQLVIISRETPRLSIPRLRASREVLEIRPRDLCFSVAESAAFLEQFLGAPLPVNLVEMLTERTEGWIAGLRLAAVSMRGQPDYAAFVENFHGTNRYIMEYLVDEIVMQQPPAIQQFLLQTSILNRFCDPLCDAVIGNSDPPNNGQAYLERLQAANFLLVPQDQENHWYRYHHLFQDLLRHKLMAEAGPQQVATLHTRAAGWLAENGLVEEALHHLLAAGEPQVAAQLVEDNRHRLLNQDNWRTLDHWLALLPAELLQQRPGLLMARALICLFTYNLERIPSLIQAAELHLQEPALSLSQEETSLIGAEIDGCRGIFECLQGQGASSFDHLQQALSQISPKYTYWRGLVSVYFCVAAQMIGQREIALQTVAKELQDESMRENALTVRLLAAQFIVYLTAGELPRFAQLAEHTLKLCERHNYTNLQGWTHYLLGYGHYLWNNLESAVSHLTQAVKLRYNQHVKAAIESPVLLALIYQARQQPTQANKTIELLLDYALQRQNPAHMAVVDSAQARLALRQDNLEAAMRWAQTADMNLDNLAMTFWFELPRLTYCRVLLAQGTAAELHEAIEKLQAHLNTATEQHTILHIIEILSLLSLAYQAQGQVEEALAALKRALVLARPGGFIRTFVDCGSPMADMLRQLAGQGVAPEYIRQILAAFGDDESEMRQDEPDGRNRQPLIEPLTDREFEILALLAERQSNQEIAQSLHISIPTVKSHTTHIYQKLGVNSRYQAVAKARSLNLLPPDNNKTPY